jgi:arylformamidase
MLPFDLSKCRIVDLTHVLRPFREYRKIEIHRGVIEYDGTYMHEVSFHSHLGTHVEVPAHFYDGGTDLSQLPVETFIGRGVLLDFDFLGPREPITVEAFEQAARGRLRPGDILLLRSNYPLDIWADPLPPDERPAITVETAQRMANLPVKMFGFDLSINVGYSVEEGRQIHDITMGKDIPWIEVLMNLDQIKAEEFTLIALPYPVVGLDAIPVRVVALEAL